MNERESKARHLVWQWASKLPGGPITHIEAMKCEAFASWLIEVYDLVPKETTPAKTAVPPR